MCVPMTSYEEAYRDFRWQLPERFNFGRDVVDAFARSEPDKLALLWCDQAGAERRFSFGDIRGLSNRLANLLVATGVRPGDRAIVMLPRIPHWQIAMVACLKVGAVAVPCIDMLTEKDVRYRVNHSGARAAITTRECSARFADAAAFQARVAVGGGPGWLDFDDAVARQSDSFTPVDTALDDPAVIYYTSGSTGLPKGVTHVAQALYCWRESARYWLGLGPDDLIWCTADTGWSKAGTSILFGPWSCGSAVLFHHGRFDPERRLELLERYGVTVFCAAATEFRQLVNQDFSRRDLRRLRRAVSAGEPVNPDVVRRWQECTGVSLMEGYGQTETLMTVVNYPGEPGKPGSMGRPLPGTATAILDESGAPLPPNERGQLALRLPNPQMMLGYWQDPERTAATLVTRDGVDYFLTGDLAAMDDEGFIFYAGRVDDVIGSAGYRIGPAEVETALLEHPAVLECAVVGSPDAKRGEVVKAFVVLRAGYPPGEELAKELQEHVKGVTAPYKYPRQVEFIAELPKTASGKLLRRVLRDREYARPGKQ